VPSDRSWGELRPATPTKRVWTTPRAYPLYAQPLVVGGRSMDSIVGYPDARAREVPTDATSDGVRRAARRANGSSKKSGVEDQGPSLAFDHAARSRSVTGNYAVSERSIRDTSERMSDRSRSRRVGGGTGWTTSVLLRSNADSPRPAWPWTTCPGSRSLSRPRPTGRMGSRRSSTRPAASRQGGRSPTASASASPHRDRRGRQGPSENRVTATQGPICGVAACAAADTWRDGSLFTTAWAAPAEVYREMYGRPAARARTGTGPRDLGGRAGMRRERVIAVEAAAQVAAHVA
jgi:hypothetical protein